MMMVVHWWQRELDRGKLGPVSAVQRMLADVSCVSVQSRFKLALRLRVRAAEAAAVEY